MTIAPSVRFGDGMIDTLPALLKEAGVRRVFMVIDAAACAASGASRMVDRVERQFSTACFDVTSPLPRLDVVEAGYRQAAEQGPDAYLAIGGGTAIDLVKLIRLAATHEAGMVSWNGTDPGDAIAEAPFIACPTTAGSGSEATHFAVVYAGGAKRSIEHPSLMPTHVILDPVLTWSLPAYQTAATGFDALAQGIESFWSVRATPSTQAIACGAIDMAWKHLVDVVRIPTPAGRRAMMRAAHLSGCAINLTRTTGCHALSYDLSYRFKVAHGHAVALTLPVMLHFIAGVTDHDVNDPRGKDYVRLQIGRLCDLLGFATVDDACYAISERLRRVGLATRLTQIGVATPEERARVAAAANTERLGNNPRRLDADRALALLDAIA